MAITKENTRFPQPSEICFQLSMDGVCEHLHQDYSDAVRAFIRYNEDEANVKVSAVTDAGAEMVLFHRDANGVSLASTMPSARPFNGYDAELTYIVYVFDCKTAQLVVSREVSGEHLMDFLGSYQYISGSAPHLYAGAFPL